MLNFMVQTGDVKPLGPIWPKLPTEQRIKRDRNGSKQEDERSNRKDRRQGDNEDGHSIDEYV
jgi:hypothetical protein